MLHSLSYQLYGSEHEYRYEHRISAATQRAGPPGGRRDDRDGTGPVERSVAEGQCATC